MAATKESLAAGGAVSDQQALVNLLLSKKTNKPLRHVIPGGKHMFTEGHEMDIKDLEVAAYTWLRRVRYFDECTLSFTKDTTKYKTKTVRTIDFPTEGTLPIWAIPSKGKAWLASRLAEVVAKGAATGSLVSITAKKDGLYVSSEPSGGLSPESEDWEPHIEFIRSKRGEYNLY